MIPTGWQAAHRLALGAWGGLVLGELQGRLADDEAAGEIELDRWTRWVYRSTGVGAPLALAALYLGGQRVGWR